MITVDCDCSALWPSTQDWEAICAQAVLAAFKQALGENITHEPREAGISIKLSGNAEVQALNSTYRGKDKPTNVLSFPMLESTDLGTVNWSDGTELLLGDIILAQEVCTQEAKNKTISLNDHVTHLVVHGTLHLLGYDHQSDNEAAKMESLEIKALASLGLADPYSRTDHDIMRGHDA